MFKHITRRPLHTILTQIKDRHHAIQLSEKMDYNFNFLEALFLNAPIKLIAHENENGWLVFSNDASVKLKTLTDFLEDKVAISGFEFMTELNGLKWSELAYSYKFQLERNNLSIVAVTDLDQLNLFTDRFQAI